MTRERFTLLAKIGGTAAIGFLIAPIIFKIIGGLAGMGIAAAMIIVGNALLPALTEWAAQLKYGALRAVINRAPVDSLIQRGRERWDALNTQAKLLQTQAAALQTFKRKAISISRTYPEEAPVLNKQLLDYEQLFAYRVEAFKEAKKKTQEFMRMIDKAEAMYEMAKTDEALGDSFGKQTDFMAAFREKTAFDAIDRANDMAIANLQMALVDNDYASKIETPPHAITYDNQHNVVLGDILDVKQEVPR